MKDTELSCTNIFVVYSYAVSVQDCIIGKSKMVGHNNYELKNIYFTNYRETLSDVK